MPPANPVNTPPFANQSVPLIVYSNVPEPPVAVTVIVPSVNPQFVGSLDATFVIDGAPGTVMMIGLSRILWG